jgi:hypothetical protein
MERILFKVGQGLYFGPENQYVGPPKPNRFISPGFLGPLNPLFDLLKDLSAHLLLAHRDLERKEGKACISYNQIFFVERVRTS